MVNKAAAFFFHLSPVVPFLKGYVYAGFAMILLVSLAYIKTNKLRAILAEMRQAGKGSPDELRSLEKAIAFWRSLTFLPEQ
jgi:hypothetical protein